MFKQMSKQEKIDSILYWLRNGHGDNGEPFLNPEDIYIADPELEVNYHKKDIEHPIGDVSVYVPDILTEFYAPLDEEDKIIWEDWNIC